MKKYLIENPRFFLISLIIIGVGLIIGTKIINLIGIAYCSLYTVDYWKKIIKHAQCSD